MMIINFSRVFFKNVQVTRKYNYYCSAVVVTTRKQSTTTPNFERKPNFINRNRRQIINIVGAFFIISFCGYNIEVEKAWKRKESEVSELQKELEELKARVLDPAWLKTVECKIRLSSDCTSSKGLLTSEIAKRIDGRK